MRKAMKKIRFDNEKDIIFKNMLLQLKFYEKQCRPIDKCIKIIAKGTEDVKILMSIPLIDYYLACLLSSYIGDVHRFDSNDKLAAFFGIIPSIKESSTIKKSGHMSNEGIREVCACIHNAQTHENDLQDVDRKSGMEISKSCIDR
jgi:transposase